MSTSRTLRAGVAGVAIASGWCASLRAQTTFDPRMLPATNAFLDIAVADFNGDGRTDIACTTADELSIHLSNGQGRFAPPIVRALTTALHGAVPTLVAGDLDNDGDEDLILGNLSSFPTNGELVVLINNGLGVFGQGTSVAVPQGVKLVIAADFDSNGTLDVFATKAIVSQAIVFSGNGAGGWVGSSVQALGDIAISARAADFDGDGDLDIAIARQSGGFEIWINDGGLAFHGSAFYSDPPYSWDLAVEDFDGDGDVDVVHTGTGHLALRRNDGAGNFGPLTSFPLPANIQNVYELATVDIDHDGHADLLARGGLGNYAGAISVARGLGGGAFAPFVENGLHDAGSFAIGDLDGDGELDVVSSNRVASGLDLMWGDGSGRLGPARVDLTLPAERIVRADFDGDGRDDFATAPMSTPPASTVTVALQSTPGVYAISTLALPGSVSSIAAGDFDGDSDVDLAADLADDTLWACLNDGTGHFGAPIGSAVTVKVRSSAAADLNGDGLDDLVVGHNWYLDQFNSPVAAWYGCVMSNGNGTFSSGPALPGASTLAFNDVFEFAVGRFNADARDDVAVTTFLGCHTIVSSGATGFTVTTIASGNYYVAAVASCDLDGDGNLDLVFGGGAPHGGITALGDGQGAFTTSPAFPLPGQFGPKQMRAGDFDGDGDPDVAYIDDASTVYLLVNNWPMFGVGPERFSTATAGPAGGQGFFAGGGVVALDANSDGRTDLALTDPLLPRVRLLLQTKVWEHPDTYCSAKTTSNGCVPAIGSLGSPSATATSGFTISCSNAINNKTGMLFYSLSGRAALPFHGGTMCVLTPRYRTPLRFSNGNPPPDDCSGVFALDFNAFAHGLAGGSPSSALTISGTAVTAQWWGRDPAFARPARACSRMRSSSSWVLDH